ncbi:MAG TPA: molybdopterin-dependent oxidoreductase [Niabella sp.]|nr:molybdopterin-dependent oxidoreductase [Niabella sp.]HQW14976.1 molybdopterin-dependent oxidoreductase [Niabella sp.]HQX20132.1 molybdopterin-dependent oxidoreductase [Niabella sp.]HQX40356.1 molybdopterin-dependent oxidoreductase [Niabella sp.]HRB06737.1 molybdopterin-dependent oxidoreductase [Niabella sp.]
MSLSTSNNSSTTTCCYCGVGCGITVIKDKLGSIQVAGNAEHPVNKGMLCSKGMNLHYTVNDTSDRLLFPEMRYARNQPRQRVSWEAALERTAAVFKTFIEKYGPDSVAFYASGQCLTEEYYVVNKLIKGFIGSNNIDTNSRLCMSSAVVGYKMSLGEDSVPVCYDDLDLADVIFVAGANPAWCHPILWRRVEAAKEKNPDLKIIVSDPRLTQTCSFANLHLQLNPGTDITLHHAIGRAIIEHGDIDLDFVKHHTEGFEKYRSSVFERTIEEAAIICGVSEGQIREAASMIGHAKGFMTMWTMGLNQSVVGVNKNLSLINLNLITGHIGKPGSGPLSLTGQPNAMGGREVGGLSNLLPAHRDLGNEQQRNEVERFWKVPLGTIPSKPGLTATEMFEALEDGRLKAIWILCTNPLISLPDVRRAEAALKKARFVVVQDISNKPETIQYADVVLPAAAWTEKEGTMTNAERRISYLHRIIDPPGEALPDSEIVTRFAKKMGYAGFDYNSSSEIFAEHAALTQGTNTDISGLSYEVLKKQLTVQWPYPKDQNSHRDTVGTKRLFTDKQFYTQSKKAIIHSFSDENLSESLSPDFPLILTTGRIRDQWHTMSKTGKVNKLKLHIATSFLEIHPMDAAERNLQNGDMVVVKSRRGEVCVPAKISTDIKRGVVFMPMHWGKILNSDLNRVNNITSNLVDPKSKEPDFKFTAVAVAPFQKPRQKIFVVGAGAGACGFVKSYREINTTDAITVFSKEDFPFYNRVLLPDYISGVLQWDNMIKMTDEEEYQNNIKLHRGVSIQHINRSEKTVTDSKGNVHKYDLLILATGSRSTVLRDVPALKGIFTMRNRNDADQFLSHANEHNGRVVIIGGGLLGIELAASLKQMNIETTIIQRTSRLMNRQLDILGSQLLQDELIDKGIEIYYNDEIDRFLGTSSITGIKLKSGLKIDCTTLVMAIGTTPNIEIAKAADLICKRGVVVNDYMQTSDPDIFAIGEIAAHKGQLFGITAAAEQQAEIVARYLGGNIARYYDGSISMNILKIHGMDMCSLGEVECPDDPAYEEVVFIDKAKRYYKKCIIHKDRLIGAILIGDKVEFLEYKNLIENKIELSEKRLQLLRSGKTVEPVKGRLVCSCNNVGEGNLMNRISDGCKDHLQLCQLSGAGMGCGSCRPEVKNILEAALSSLA